MISEIIEEQKVFFELVNSVLPTYPFQKCDYIIQGRDNQPYKYDELIDIFANDNGR